MCQPPTGKIQMGAYATSPGSLPDDTWQNFGAMAVMGGYPATVLSGNTQAIVWPGRPATVFAQAYINGNNEKVQVRINSTGGVLATSAQTRISTGAVSISYTGALPAGQVWGEIWSYYRGSPIVAGQDKTFITIT